MSWWVPIATMLGSAALSRNQQASQPVRAGNRNLLASRPAISLSPKRGAYSLMTMPPVGYQAASPASNIPAATLDAGGGATDPSMSMASAGNLARMGRGLNEGGFPKKTPPQGRSTPVGMAGTGQIRNVPNHLWGQGITTPAQYDAYLASQNSQKANSGPLYGNIFTREQLWEQEMMRRYKNSLDQGQTIRPLLWGLLGGMG